MSTFSTNPGDRSVSELEDEVNQQRDRVSATVDELQSRASAANIVDQVVKAVGENGGEVTRNLGRSLRENPLAALLTGVGLAWLIAGSGRPREDDGHPSWRDRDRDFGEGSDFSDYGAGSGLAPRHSYSGYGNQSDGEGGGIGDRVSGVAGSVSEAAGGLRDKVSDAAGAVGDSISGAVSGLRERASDLSQSAHSALHSTGDAMRSAGQEMRNRAGSVRQSTTQSGSDVAEGLDALMQDQPLVLGALAMAVGAAIGGALPRSRVEDRMFGAQSDRAMERVQALAKEQGAKVQATAEAVVEEVADIASETRDELGSKLPSGQDIADAAEARVREAAERLQQAASQDQGRSPSSD